MTKDELRWQAESDASTMARYQEILADKQRLSRAVKAAKTEAANLNKRAAAMQSASKTKISSRKK